MKKSTIAVAALLTALATAPVMSVAYADDTAAPAAATPGCAGSKDCAGSKGCAGSKDCAGNKDCAGSKGCGGCSGD